MLIYEDAAIHAFVVPDGAAVGHVQVMPKQQAKYFDELPEDVCVQMWWAASFAATTVFEGLGAQGTNIIAFEGDQLALHVLPRAMNDGLQFQWEMNRADQGELTDVAGKLSESLWYIGKKDIEPEQEAPPETPAPQATPEPEEPLAPREPRDLQAEDKKIDYRLKQLDRRM